MQLTYFKRFRMEMDLAGRDLTGPPLPADYRLVAWDPDFLDEFAEAKYFSFRHELDANVFPCLGELSGCRRLMQEIARKPGFLPEATWLLVHTPRGASRPENCGTVQGIRDRTGLGAIQNLGVAPEHRNLKLGTHLLLAALRGFQAAGITRSHLEVTAFNEGAIRLYRRLGFVPVKTVFKPADSLFT